MTLQNTNPNSSEYSPEQQAQRELSPEAVAAQGELHDAWNDTLYGFTDKSHTEVEQLDNRVDVNQIRRSMDVDKQPRNDQIEDAIIEENAVMRNTREATQMTQQTMAELGVDEVVPQRDTTSRVVGEQLSDGTTEYGDLYQEDRRDVAEAMVAQQFAEQLDAGNTDMLKSIDPLVGNKILVQLWQLKNKYGEIRSVPNDELASIGELIMRAEKNAPVEEQDASSVENEYQTQDESVEEARRLVEQAHAQLVE